MLYIDLYFELHGMHQKGPKQKKKLNRRMMYSFTCSQISLLVHKDVFALIFGLVILHFSTCQNNLINVSLSGIYLIVNGQD